MILVSVLLPFKNMCNIRTKTQTASRPITQRKRSGRASHTSEKNLPCEAPISKYHTQYIKVLGRFICIRVRLYIHIHISKEHLPCILSWKPLSCKRIKKSPALSSFVATTATSLSAEPLTCVVYCSINIGQRKRHSREQALVASSSPHAHKQHHQITHTRKHMFIQKKRTHYTFSLSNNRLETHSQHFVH